MKIMIPLHSAQSVGLREVVPAADIPKIYPILRNKDVSIDKQTWNKLGTGNTSKRSRPVSVYEIARVLRDLLILKPTRISPSRAEDAWTPRKTPVKEISVATKSEETKVEQDLQRYFTLTRHDIVST